MIVLLGYWYYWIKEMHTVLIVIESDKSVVRKMELSWIMCKKGLFNEYESECIEIVEL